MNSTIPSHTINYEELAQAVKNKREQVPELKTASDQEILAHILKEHPAHTQSETALTTPATSTAASKQTQTADGDLPSYAAEISEENKAEAHKLVQITFEKGIEHGIKEARKQEPFMIDLYHDILSQTLAEEIKKRNLL